MKASEFRKLIREEVRKVINEGTDPVQEYVDWIVDLASSGAGAATGLQSKELAKELANIVKKIKVNNLTNAVDKALVKYINNTDEAFTENDIEALQAVGFKMRGVNYDNLGF